MFHFIFAVCQIITSIQSVTFTQSLTRHQHLSPSRFQRDRVIKQLSNEGHGMNIKSWYFASNFPGPRTLKKTTCVKFTTLWKWQMASAQKSWYIVADTVFGLKFESWWFVIHDKMVQLDKDVVISVQKEVNALSTRLAWNMIDDLQFEDDLYNVDVEYLWIKLIAKLRKHSKLHKS